MSNFADLKLRVFSALVLAVVAGVAIWFGGMVFLVLLSLVGGIMIWELARMLSPKLDPAKLILLGLIGAAAVFRVGFDNHVCALAALVLAPVLGMVLLPKDRGLFVGYASFILFAVAGLFWLRDGEGLVWAIWLIAVVIASDVGGYFFGRILGGPKILPVISPKKTWSGTLGGWLLAALIGFIFANYLGANAVLVVLSVLTAIAAQIGDVVESAIKRHTGIKDSSNLIPGHGGFLDRFDALIAASLFVAVITYFPGLPGMGIN